MILIISDSDDASTTYVLKWLNYYNKKYIRVNSQDKIDLKFEGEDILFKINDLIFNFSDIKSFWYRRGFFNFRDLETINIKQFDELRKEEFSSFIKYIYYRLEKLKSINSIFTAVVNKLIVNDLARDFKIITPKDYIFSNSSSLKNKINKSKLQLISKVVSGNCMYNFEDFTIFNYTKIVNLENINTDDFFPSLVQDRIEKKYELRVFYLEGLFYSMAIFSQNDSQTNVDFRNYNYAKPNRTVPFQLPKEIECKLDLLMKKIGLNCGSLDLIVTPKNEFVFLEVNPVGQFGMTSYPCNYNLEKIIANYL